MPLGNNAGTDGLEQDVRHAVVVEVARALDLPIRTGVERADTADERRLRAVHFPHGNRAVVVLPNEIVHAVAVEVADALDLPFGTGIERADRTDERRVAAAVHFPHRRLAVVVLKDDVGKAVTIEVAAALDVPAREPTGRERTRLGDDVGGVVVTVHHP